MVNAQEWLEKKYPQSKRKDVTELDISWLRKEAKKDHLTGSLSLKGFTNLKELRCSHSDDPDDAYISLTKLDVSDCPNLEKLSCGGNQLTSLDVSKNKNLKEISCSKNKINILDISNLDKLDRLDCRNNQLVELHLGRNNKLRVLLCSGNLLTKLNFSSLNPEVLITIFLDNNNFPTSDLSCFSQFTKLEDLRIGTKNERVKQGSYNHFTGSLQLLAKTKLKKLDIINTNINSGLEYLPETLEKIYYLKTHGRGVANPQSEQLIPSLEPHYKEREWLNALGEWDSEMYYDMQSWRKANESLVNRVKNISLCHASLISSSSPTYQEEFGRSQINLNQEQLQELANIVLPDNQVFDFITLKKEIQKLKSESLTNQIENKKTESETLTNLLKQEKLHFKTRQELQNLMQTKQREIRGLEHQLSNLQISEQQAQIQQNYPPKK